VIALLADSKQSARIDKQRGERLAVVASVILINPFEVPADVSDEAFVTDWDRAADYMSRQQGFIGTRLHRALRPDARFRFVNVAEWESATDFQTAVATDEFRELVRGEVAGSPALYEIARER
jgi:heme oxygenase (mycobilin-producing)